MISEFDEKTNQVIIYQKPIITKCPDNWEALNDEEREDYCKKIVEYNNNPKFDTFFQLKKNCDDVSFEMLKAKCQMI